MSPDPNVRGQALALAAALLTAAVLGPAKAALACSLVTGLAAWWLQRRYRGDVAAAGASAEVPAERERLDAMVAGDVRGAVAVGVVAAALMVGFDVERPDVGAAPWTPVSIALAATGVLVSSLVDWYVILPRVSGMLGVRPCRAPQGRFPRWPRTFRLTTRWWYLHRIVAVVFLSYGLSLAIALTFNEHVSLFGGSTVITTVVLGFLASYRKAIGRVSMEAMHPSMIVGQTVRRRPAERVWRRARWRRRSLPLPWPSSRATGPFGEREYVFDVSVEKVQVVPAAEYEGELRRDERGAVVFVQHPTTVRHAHIGATRDASEPFAGCAGRCSGINWYCVENPYCFAEK